MQVLPRDFEIGYLRAVRFRARASALGRSMSVNEREVCAVKS